MPFIMSMNKIHVLDLPPFVLEESGCRTLAFVVSVPYASKHHPSLLHSGRRRCAQTTVHDCFQALHVMFVGDRRIELGHPVLNQCLRPAAAHKQQLLELENQGHPS